MQCNVTNNEQTVYKSNFSHSQKSGSSYASLTLLHRRTGCSKCCTG